MNTKQCNKCKAIKNISEFNRNKSRKDGHHSICRICMKLYLQSHYKNNTEYYKNKSRKAEQLSHHIITSIKSNTPCNDCGKYYDPICMDFDHVNPLDKSFGICGSFKSLGLSLLKILKEIEKCDVVCSNCHRLRTKTRNGWG